MGWHEGVVVTCDQISNRRGEYKSCSFTLHAKSAEEARTAMEQDGWSVVGEHTYCRYHTKKRAERPKLRDIVPAEVELFDVDSAIERAGFTETGKDDDYEISCCGQPTEVSAFLGSGYRAECKKCGTAIVDVTGPQFEGCSVRTPDPDKIDTETDVRWIVQRPDVAALNP